jgi:BNR repeat-like domain
MNDVLAVGDQFTVADPLQESTYGLLAFPWLTRLGDTLFLTYHDGHDGPSGGDNKSRLKVSTDLGRTWSLGQIVWDEALDTGAQCLMLASGALLLTTQGYTLDVPSGVYAKLSTDLGVTWGPTIPASDSAFSAGHTYTSSAPLELPATGMLLWPVYGSDTGHDGNLTKLLTSLDGGLTWTTGATVMSLPGGVGANEATLQLRPDGVIGALVRCTDFNARYTTSSDGGVTWSPPVVAFTACDGRIDWLITASGRNVAAYRDSGTACAALTWSLDDWATAAAPVQIHGPDKRTSYSALLEVEPGAILAVLGEIDDGEATGRLMGRYIMEQHGITPQGQPTYITALQQAAGVADYLAWDTFNRPNNAHGLGSADSGHQWLEWGGTNNSDWQLVGGTARNTGGSTYHSTTLNVGTTAGLVEASLMWTGTTSSPLGLCARRSTTTGHALVAKLDATGHTARISYYNGTTVSDLAVTSTGISYPAGSWYRFRFIVRGDHARLFIDGHEVVAYQLTATDHANLDAGTRWGLWGGGSTGATYYARNLIVSQ